MGKKVPKTKHAENSGLLAIAQYAHRMGWAWRPTPNDDYGLDGELEPVVNGEATGRIIKVQVKSGASYFSGDNGESFYYLASKDDLTYWDHVNLPVLLVVHDPDSQQTYGIELHAAIARDPSIRASRRIQFTKAMHVLDANSESRLLSASEGEEATGRIFRRPGPKYSELLYSNLLSAKMIPARVYGAPTKCRTTADIRNALGNQRKTPAIPSDEMLWTFADLTAADCTLRAACNHAKATPWLLHDWVLAHPNGRGLLIRLMNTCLRKKLAAKQVTFDQDKHRYYFPTEDEHERRLTWQSLHNRISRPVVYPHRRSDDTTDYWVHWAASFRFLFLCEHLYLMIEPAMVFTRDGFSLVGGEEMGRLSTSRRSHQYNRNVLGMLYFWRELLSDAQRDIVIFPAPSPQRLAFHAEFVSANASFGIDGDQIPIKSLLSDLDDVDLAIGSDDDRDADPQDGDGTEDDDVDEVHTEGEA